MSAIPSNREPCPFPGGATASALASLLGPRSSSGSWGHRAEDGQFIAMVRGYRRTGGLANGNEIARLLRRRSDQPISTLARWIVDRSVVSFVWQSKTLLPLFQFDPADMSLRRGTSEVVRELARAFDDWDLATWFVRPNSCLQGAAPADVVVDDQPAVLLAARAAMATGGRTPGSRQ